jgi:hypothetical protein
VHSAGDADDVPPGGLAAVTRAWGPFANAHRKVTRVLRVMMMEGELLLPMRGIIGWSRRRIMAGGGSGSLVRRQGPTLEIGTDGLSADRGKRSGFRLE